MPRDDKARLRHMLDQARKVVARLQGLTRADLDSDEDLAAAVVWRLSVVGEAASKLTEATRATHPEIPWQQIVGMRHRLIHGYDAIDLEVVWQTIEVDLPPLIVAIEGILKS